MGHLHPIDLAMVVGFLVLMFWAGIAVSRWIKEADDFYVASRELTPFILAATITATNVNMYSFIGQSGEAYKSGFGIIWNCWLGNMALVFSGIFVVPILRRLMVRTVPEFLELRYNRHIRLFIGVVWALKLCFWLAVILMAANAAAVGITGIGADNPWIWYGAFAAIAIVYSAVGGAWAVAMTDTIQFVIMLAGALIVLPVAMGAAGWMPALVRTLEASGRSEHLKFVTQAQEFNWLFILSMLLLSTKWACVDQAILQRAFGARNPRTVAKGMVLSGIITTPFAFLWILPGLANIALQPANPATGLPGGMTSSDMIMPVFLATYLKPGVLGLVMCGLLASQLSTISSDINSVATLMTNDVYHNLRRDASPKHLLRVVRGSSLVAGALMIGFAHFVVSRFGGVVEANLTMVGIVDMPVFVITIVYGLFSRRANWQGAVGGYVLGAAAGVACFLYFRGNPDLSDHRWLNAVFGEDIRWSKWAKSLATLASTSAALIGTPLVSAFFPPPPESEGRRRIFVAFQVAAAGAGGEIHLWATTVRGKLGQALMAAGFATLLAGVLSGSVRFAQADVLAIGGMLVFFAGGLLRAYSD